MKGKCRRCGHEFLYGITVYNFHNETLEDTFTLCDQCGEEFARMINRSKGNH
jgi:transcription elongation factor Elf1